MPHILEKNGQVEVKNMGYHYPIDINWSKDEVIDVVDFLTTIEKAYESKVPRDDVLDAYRKFKRVIPSKSEEKQILAQFEKESGYSGYHTVKKARESSQDKISMKR